MKTTILGRDDIREIAQRIGLDALMDEMIARLTVAFREYDAERIRVPIRAGFNYNNPTPGLLEWMPLLEVGEKATIKVVGYHPANPAVQDLPTVLSTIGMFDSQTGHLAGLVDGTFVTALRTGAASAVASTVLASPESQRLGLIGCGAQAVTQVHALTRVFDIQEVVVYDIDHLVGQNFIDRVSALMPQHLTVCVAPVDKVEATVDILCTQTSVAPGVKNVTSMVEFNPWLHVNAVGADFPGKTELPLSFLLESFVCPDFRAQAEREGECQQLTGGHETHIGPSLAEVVQDADQHHAMRSQPSVFDSTGFALEDHVAVEMMLDYATELGLGAPYDIECVSADPRNPYGFIDQFEAGYHAQDAASHTKPDVHPS